RNIERNHTATHLVHAALRTILGPHVRQQGSVVAPERLRFDFAHHGPLDDPTLARIEEEVNRQVWANLPVTTREMPYKQAIAAGAMAFFTEKYGDIVRVVDVAGVSLELCGGTHVPSTGQIALFRFTHETGAAAGVRRIEAVTVLFTNGERPGIHVGVTDDLVAQGVKAGDIAAALAAVSGGKGGGRPHFASAGAGDPAKLGETRAQTAAIVRRLLAR